jgi:hypothetical protein
LETRFDRYCFGRRLFRCLDIRWGAFGSARCRSIGCCSHGLGCRDARVLDDSVALWLGSTLRVMHGLNVSYGEELAVLPRLLGRCGSDAGQRRWSCLVECETPLWLSWCLRARAGRRALGVGHDDRLKDVPCLSLVFSVDRDSYLELFVHFLEVFLQCYGRSEYARGNRSEKSVVLTSGAPR